MARNIYASGRGALAAYVATLDLRAQAVTSAYTYSDAHSSMSDVPAGNRVASPADLTMSSSGSAADAADFTITDLGVGETIDGFVIYQEGASDAARTLWGYVDEDASGTAINIVGDGNNVSVTINTSGLLTFSDAVP